MGRHPSFKMAASSTVEQELGDKQGGAGDGEDATPKSTAPLDRSGSWPSPVIAFFMGKDKQEEKPKPKRKCK